jgi:hypothetical protein
MKTKVFFRVFPEGDIIAIFGTLADLEGNLLSYQHIGQHGACDPNLIHELEVATEDQYKPLCWELISLGYDLEIVGDNNVL